MLARIIDLFGTSNQTEISKKTGIKVQTLNHVFNGRNKVSIDHIIKIHEAMPEISLNWLMFGEGEKFVSSSPKRYDTTTASQPSVVSEPLPLDPNAKEMLKEVTDKLSMVSTNNDLVVAQIKSLQEQNAKILECLSRLTPYI